MRFELLEVFVTVVNTRSFAAAARILYVTQPSVSISIRSLEEEIGQPLLIRPSSRYQQLELTEAGRIFYDYAYDALNNWNNIQLSLRQRNNPTHSVIIGVSPTSSYRIAPILLNQLKLSFPSLQAKFVSYSGSSVHLHVKEHSCDIGISSTLPQDENILYEKFFFDPLVLIAPKAFGLSAQISIWDLFSVPMVMREDGCNINRLIEQAFQRAGINVSELNIISQVYGNAAVLQYVTSGLAAGFVAKSLLSSQSNHSQNWHQIRIRDLELPRYLYLLRLNHEMTPEERTLWTFAQSAVWRKDFDYNTFQF